MKRTKYHTMLKWLAMLLVAPLLASCYDDDGSDAQRATGPVTVRFHVSADGLGDLNNTRAADPYAVDGEFMHSLCVFVVDANGVIEAKFGPDILDGNADAVIGNLTDWTSDTLTLSVGPKTIYAFSNWENMDSSEWEALIAKTVGESITDADLNFTVDDPASKVNIAGGQYIPMSGKATATVSDDLNYSSQLISVGMDRLVSKVTIAINGETGDYAKVDTLGVLTFSGWADKVPMMSDDLNDYTYNYNGYYSKELNQSIGIGATGVNIASFYVNESYRPSTEDGYEITLDTDRYGGTFYTATTARHDIQRNYIYPITLTLDQYVLDLEVHAWTSPLGIEEVPYYNIEVDGNTYRITLLDVTSTFKIAPSLLDSGGNEVSVVSWKWTYVNYTYNDGKGDGSVVEYGSDGSVTVTGLTATPGYEYGFTLVVDWTTTSSSNVTTSHSRTYNFFVTLVEGWPEFSKGISCWELDGMGDERLNMIIKNK